MSDQPIGKKQWAIPGGFVPVDSTGPEKTAVMAAATIAPIPRPIKSFR